MIVRSWLCGLLLFAGSGFIFAEPLRLDDVWALAAANNIDIESARVALERAKANEAAVRATYSPKITGTGSYTIPHFGGDSPAASLGLSLTQPVFPSILTRSDLGVAGADVKFCEAQLAQAEASVRANVANAYIEVWYAQESVRLSQSIADRRRQNADLVSARFEAGREHRGSQLWALAQYHQALADVVQAGRALIVSRAKLDALMGRRIQGEWSVVTPSILAGSIPVQSEIATLAETVPLVMQSRATLQSLIFQKSQLNETDWPALNLGISGVQSGVGLANSRQSYELSTRIQVSVPLFDGGIIQERRKSAELAIGLQERVLVQLIRDRIVALETSLLTYNRATDLVTVQQEFYAAAVTRGEIANAQYTSGLLTYENWDVIESELINQQMNRYNNNNKKIKS
ncbi:TolC family protein [bacterium]|nr:TolC family protein [bacterium]